MTTRNPITMAIATLAIVGVLAGTAVFPMAATADEPARLDLYKAADGQHYFALSMQPDIQNRVVPTNVVVMFDTSASQSGAVRTEALSALQSMLTTLNSDTKVMLLAVDLKAVPMSTGFVAPNSPEMQDALAKLNRRVPLGSTDMAAALRTTAEAFAEDSTARRAAVYIGDGVTGANFLQGQEFANLLNDLVNKEIAVSSFGLGPQVDAQLLAALANQTGGRLVLESNELTPSQSGEFLAASAEGPVVWPTDVTMPQSFEAVYPTKLPPLRADRDTVVIGKSSGDGPVEVNVQGELDGAAVDMEFAAVPGMPNDDNAYLMTLVDNAAPNGGLTLPTVGTAGLIEARQIMDQSVAALNQLSRNAVAARNFEGAKALANQALAVDPNNPDAQAVVGAADRVEAGDDGDLLDAFVEGGDLIEQVQGSEDVLVQITREDVRDTLLEARANMADNPQAAEADLKLMIDRVKNLPLPAVVRAELLDQMEVAVESAMRRRVELDEEVREREERRARAEEQARLLDNLRRDEQRIAQLMARFDSLMKEGRFREAEDEVALEALSIDPNNATLVSARLNARYGGAYADIMAIVDQRRRAFVDTMFEVERSGIPFPDEPPIVYPPAEVWEELTLRRRKYASVDLEKESGAEGKISEQLKEPTTMDFEEQPLEEVVEYLEDLHGIPIQVDSAALRQIGLGSDSPVNLKVQGVSLRAGLRLMLRGIDPDLTYTIKDEVLMLTTREVAEENLVTKVYPVADLVLPIDLGTYGGNFGGGQTGNNFGQNFGGGGGGGFNGGGGGFGGGGFGGGGGGNFGGGGGFAF